MTATRTFVLLELSSAAYAEVRAKLKDAGYDHVFQRIDGRETVDMYGIALTEELPIKAAKVVRDDRD